MRMVEFTDKQIERIDDVENAVFEMCQVLTENMKLEWDMSYIGEIADLASDILVKHGFKVRYPAIVEDENGNEYIEEYWSK